MVTNLEISLNELHAPLPPYGMDHNFLFYLALKGQKSLMSHLISIITGI